MTGAADHELTDRLRRLVDDEELRPGERIGSERMLADRLGVARTALRRALDELEAEGRVRRTMGRAGGVFAADGRIERQLNTVAGVPAMLRQQGVRSTTVVLRVELGASTAAESRSLDLERGATVARIVRRRDADGVPWSLDSSVLPAALVPGITGRDLSASLYALLEQEYGLAVADADETIDVVPATASTADALDVAEATPLLQVWRIARDPDGRAFEFAHDLFRADRTRVHLRRYGASWKRADAG
jgi:GntR family transcriptional regulator